jgi:hypothetical protein
MRALGKPRGSLRNPQCGGRVALCAAESKIFLLGCKGSFYLFIRFMAYARKLAG